MPNAIGAVGNPMALHGSVDNAMQALGGMDSEGFLKLLVAQLQYQSPLDPSDPGDLMTQTSALAQLDATQQLLGLHQRGLGLQQAVMAAGLLGDEVTGTDVHGNTVTGIVDAVRYTLQGPVLDVGGSELYLGGIEQIRRVADPEGDLEQVDGDEVDAPGEVTPPVDGPDPAPDPPPVADPDPVPDPIPEVPDPSTSAPDPEPQRDLDPIPDPDQGS